MNNLGLIQAPEIESDCEQHDGLGCEAKMTVAQAKKNATNGEIDSRKELSKVLLSISEKYGLSQQDCEARVIAFQQVREFLESFNKGLTSGWIIFGSSLTGAGLKQSNINICLGQPNRKRVLQVLSIIKEHGERFLHVENFLHQSAPKITFVEATSQFKFVLSYETNKVASASMELHRVLILHKFALPLTHCLRVWAKVCEVDNPDEGMLTSFGYTIIVIRFLQQQRLLPVFKPGQLRSWIPLCGPSIGVLWLRLLTFMKACFSSCLSISITTVAPKQRRPTRPCILDPVSDADLACSLASPQLVNFIICCINHSRDYFTSKDDNSAGLDQSPNLHQREREGENSDSDIEIESVCSSSDGYRSENDDSVIHCKVDSEDDDEDDGKDDGEKENSDDENSESLERPNSPIECYMLETDARSPAAQNDGKSITSPYVFDKNSLRGAKKRPILCFSCKNLGHVKPDCPLDQHRIQPLPKLPLLRVVMLEKLCRDVLEEWKPSSDQWKIRSRVVAELQKYIERAIPQTRLTLFGSSKNGFCFRDSDMDISMTINGRKCGDVNISSYLTCVERILRNCRLVCDVLAIRSAKVPIVKFCFKDIAIEADISFYNILAQRNSQLLLAYSQCDPRVQPLGYALKYFFKICEIGDASRGTISSYGCIIMLIHYLQKRSPPVLPYLQELDSELRTPVMIDGWDTQFFEDFGHIKNVWPGHGKNEESIGQLWYGFFKYYVEKFDLNTEVISIRQSKPLTKFEKDWNRYTMAIEDPFKMSHNLVAGITANVFRYIFKILVNARELYGTQVNITSSTTTPNPFDTSFLKKGLKMPQERLCKRCGRVGHTKNNCQLKDNEAEKSRPQNEASRKGKKAFERRSKSRNEVKNLETRAAKEANVDAVAVADPEVIYKRGMEEFLEQLTLATSDASSFKSAPVSNGKLRSEQTGKVSIEEATSNAEMQGGARSNVAGTKKKKDAHRTSQLEARTTTHEVRTDIQITEQQGRWNHLSGASSDSDDEDSAMDVHGRAVKKAPLNAQKINKEEHRWTKRDEKKNRTQPNNQQQDNREYRKGMEAIPSITRVPKNDRSISAYDVSKFGNADSSIGEANHGFLDLLSRRTSSDLQETAVPQHAKFRASRLGGGQKFSESVPNFFMQPRSSSEVLRKRGTTSNNRGDRGSNRGDRGSNRGDRGSNRGDRGGRRGDRGSNRGDRGSNRGDRGGRRGDRGGRRGDRGGRRGHSTTQPENSHDPFVQMEDSFHFQRDTSLFHWTDPTAKESSTRGGYGNYGRDQPRGRGQNRGEISGQNRE